MCAYPNIDTNTQTLKIIIFILKKEKSQSRQAYWPKPVNPVLRRQKQNKSPILKQLMCIMRLLVKGEKRQGDER